MKNNNNNEYKYNINKNNNNKEIKSFQKIRKIPNYKVLKNNQL